MSIKNYSLFYFSVFLAGLIFFPGTLARAQTNASSSNSEICQKLKMFPENHRGNAVYKDSIWLFSDENATIKDAVYISNLETSLFWTESAGQQFVIFPETENDKFEKLSDSLLKRKLGSTNLIFFALKDKIYCFTFLFNSISNELVDNSDDLVAFFHVAKLESDINSQVAVYQIRLHVYDYVNLKMITLPNVVFSRDLNIKLTWEEEYVVVNFGDGEKIRYPVNL